MSRHPRLIDFDAIENARELGGLRTRDGRTVRSGCLLRSGNLSRASDQDVLRLQRDFRLSEIVDLRFDAEANKDPDRLLPGARRTQLSTLPQALIDGFQQGRTDNEQIGSQEFTEALVRFATNPQAQELSRQLYPTILTNPVSQRLYGQFLRIVLHAEGGVLWHCSQGKDRAGLATVFLLTALGVDRETVLEDFSVSTIYYAPLIEILSERVRVDGGDENAINFIRAMVGVSRQNLERAIDLVGIEYGSLEEYITNQLGFTPEEQQQLRQKYLV